MIDPLSAEAFSQAYDLQQNPNAADKHLRVRFFWEDFEDTAASEKEGRPIFKSWEMCEIKYGDKDNVVCDRVKYMSPDPRKRFPVQFARFKAGEKAQSTGTPLRLWGLIASSRAKEYEAQDIHTVEELANLSDTVGQGIRGSFADRQKARDFLEMAKGQAPLAEARAELDKARDEIRSLRDEVMEMRAAMSPTEPVKRGPGRPRKIQPTPDTEQ